MDKLQNNNLPVEQVVESVQQQFVSIASRENRVTWQKESQFAVQAIYKNPLLQKCSPVSLQNAVINVASVGLSLNPAGGYAYLVPEYDKNTRNQECQLRISFKGLVKVATDSGAIAFVKAEVVKEKDEFEYLGPCEKPRHKMNPFGDRGETVGVYSIAKTTGGDFLCDVMSKAEIDQIKSKAKTAYVWNEWYDEMAKKAIIKRSSKQWPSSGTESFTEAVRIINEHEGSDFDERVEVIEDERGALPPPYPVNAFDKNLSSWLQAIGDGKKTAEDIIAMVETKGALTEEQKQQIRGEA